MIRLLILVLVTFNFSFLLAQESNKNKFSQDEVIKLSYYGKQLEESILEKNPSDTALIAKLKGEYLLDLYGYTDKEVIKISSYLKKLEQLDSINNIPKEIEVVEELKDDLASSDDIEEQSSEVFITTIFFDVNRSKPKEIDLFDFVYDLKLDKKLTVVLVGHTDGSGTDNYNLDLSILRAVSVKKYLVKQGILAERIEIKGEGEWQPVADNATEEGRASNRRVEITVK